jgi:uncharacterized membrane protein YgcG
VGTSVSAPSQTGTGAGTPATFQLGDAGTVTLTASGDQLSIASVTPNPGWMVERAEQDGPAAVEVRMESAAGEVRFEAALVRGVLVHSLDIDRDDEGDDDDDNSGSGSSGSGSGSGSSAGGSGSSGTGSGGSGGGSDD